MIELLSRPRVFVLVFWLASMFISGLLGGLLMNFDSGTLQIWILLTLLGPALVWAMLFLQGRKSASSTVEPRREVAPREVARREVARPSVSRRRPAPRSAAASAPRQ